MWRWTCLLVASGVLLACGRTQDGTPAGSEGAAGGNSGAGGTSGAGVMGGVAGGGASSATGSAGKSGSTGDFAPRKPIPCGNLQVPAEKACDGIRDCQLGNDEAGCPLYFCKDGSSRIGRDVCDGAPDCPEGEDELDDQCSSVPTGFLCTSGARVARRAVCDGQPDCEDAADEAVCPAFLCSDGAQAIADSRRCDRVKDCADESDEVGCWVP